MPYLTELNGNLVLDIKEVVVKKFFLNVLLWLPFPFKFRSDEFLWLFLYLKTVKIKYNKNYFLEFELQTVVFIVSVFNLLESSMFECKFSPKLLYINVPLATEVWIVFSAMILFQINFYFNSIDALKKEKNYVIISLHHFNFFIIRINSRDLCSSGRTLKLLIHPCLKSCGVKIMSSRSSNINMGVAISMFILNPLVVRKMVETYCTIFISILFCIIR